MRNLLANLLMIGALVVGFYAVKSMVDPAAWSGFWTFMAGDYPDFYNTHLRDRIPRLFSNPYVIGFIVMILLAMIFKRKR